ncbi:MAG: hypothetical protein KDJ98_18785 [Rhodobacteraceae bacterium]|nr:hypothetical protein [Paracoccaceae bacterium]
MTVKLATNGAGRSGCSMPCGLIDSGRRDIEGSAITDPGHTDRPTASADFNHDPKSSVFHRVHSKKMAETAVVVGGEQ